MECNTNTDDGDPATAVISSPHISAASLKHQSPVITTQHHHHTDFSMEVDSTTTEDFAGSVSENDLSCSSSDFFNTNAAASSSFTFKSLKHNNIETTSNNFCLSRQAAPTKRVAVCSNAKLGNNVKQSFLDQKSAEQMISIVVDYPNTPESGSDRSNSYSLFCCSDSEVTPQEESEISGLTSANIGQILNPVQDNGRSVIYQLLSKGNSEHIKALANKCINNKVMMFSDKPENAKNQLPTEADIAVQSPDSSVVETKRPATHSHPASLSSNKSSDKGKDVTFDLFPDISYCLDGRPVSSPVSIMSDEVGPGSNLTSSGLLSSLASPRADNSTSPVPSPGAVLFNMDSGSHQKADEDCTVDRDLAQTPETKYPVQDETLIYDDDITLQIMEEYTLGLDLIIDSSTATQAPTPVEALLTSARPHDTNLGTPLSPSGSDKSYFNDASPTSKLTSRVKELQLDDVAELFNDMDAVTSLLVSSHRENIGDFSYLSKEEMFAQQKAHCESCQLQRQTFGDLAFLPEHEYDDIYSITGIDIDNRRTIIQKYLARMEKCVRGLVHFAKAIPGFSLLDMNTQVELIKLARSEVAIFTIYPTVNLELGVSLSLGGESWACLNDIKKLGSQLAIEDYMIFCDKLQKMALSEEEEVLLKAVLVMSTDRDSTVKSPLAEEIRWQLILCLKYSLEKHREKPSLLLARYILALTQSRTVSEKFKDFIRELKMHKYSSIEQNPLMWELFSGILQEKEGNVNLSTFCQLLREGKVGIWSPCFLGDPLTG